MIRLLVRLRWFVAAPAVLVAAVLFGFVADYLLADYFVRTFVDEASPLVQAAEPSPAASPQPAGTPAATPSPQGGVAATPTPAPGGGAGTGVLRQGQFKDGEPGHNGEGRALLLRDAAGRTFVRFEDFSVTNGPDLRVMLATGDDGHGDMLELGELKATDGNQNYEVPAGTDLAKYRSVIVYCKPFRVLFAYATLGEN